MIFTIGSNGIGINKALKGFSKEELALLKDYNMTLDAYKAGAIDDLEVQAEMDKTIQKMNPTLLAQTKYLDGSAESFKNVATKASGAMRFFKNLGSSLLNNITMAAIMLAAQSFVKYIVQRGDRLDEKADASRVAWQQTTSEIQQLNSELETNKKRIEEINALKASGDIAALAAEQELKTLQETNAALQTQLDLKTMIAAGQQRSAESKAVKALSFKDDLAGMPDWIGQIARIAPILFAPSNPLLAAGSIHAYKAGMTDEFGQAQGYLAKMTDAANKVRELRKEQSLLTNDQGAWQKKQDQIEEWEGKLENYSDKFVENYGEIGTLMEGISGDTEAGRKIIAQYEALTASYKKTAADADKAVAYVPDGRCALSSCRRSRACPALR